MEAFPSYLAELAVRLDEGELRRAVLANMCDENGTAGTSGKDSVPHSELWLDFAEGMGARRDLRGHESVAEIRELTRHFHRVAGEGKPEEALAAFYAYESQVPRVAKEKERGLREMYNGDDKTCGYFTLHATADVFHSNVWRKQLENRITAQSRNGASRAGCGRERSQPAVAGSGWDRSKANDVRSVSTQCFMHNLRPMIPGTAFRRIIGSYFLKGRNETKEDWHGQANSHRGAR